MDLYNTVENGNVVALLTHSAELFGIHTPFGMLR